MRPHHPAAPPRPARRLALLGLLLAAPLARAAEGGPVDLSVRPGSTLTYLLVHKLHEVTGVSKTVEGKVRLQPDGSVLVMVRAPVSAFDSGNVNRDAHMLEATEANRFPHVTLKAVGSCPPPASFPAAVKVTVRGELTFHGVTRAVEVPVEVSFASPRRATATARFPVSLEAHGVERPSLLFVKVEDALLVTATLELAAEGS